MEEWQSSLWVAAIAAIAGLIGAAIGRERWPADLRDAKRLGEIIEKMEPGTKEHEVAAMYRDDLAARWIIGQVMAREDLRRDLALFLMGSGLMIFSIMIVVSGLYLAGVPVGNPADVKAMIVAWTFTSALLFAGGVWAGRAYRRRQDRYLGELREKRGMRAPVADWMSEFDKEYEQRRRRNVSAATTSDEPDIPA